MCSAGRGIREIAGPATLLCGCSSEGIIYRDGCSERACAVNVMESIAERCSG